MKEAHGEGEEGPYQFADIAQLLTPEVEETFIRGNLITSICSLASSVCTEARRSHSRQQGQQADAENKIARFEMAQARAQTRRYNRELRKLEQSRTDLQHQIEDAKERKETLRRQERDRTSVLETAKSDLSFSSHRKSIADSQVVQHQKDEQSAIRQLEASKLQLAKAQTEKSNAIKEVEEATRLKANAQSDKDTKQKDLETAVKKLKNADVKSDAAGKALDKAVADASKGLEDVQKAESEEADLQKKKDDAVKHASTCQKDMERAQQVANEAKSQSNECKTKLASKRAQEAALEQTVMELRTARDEAVGRKDEAITESKRLAALKYSETSKLKKQLEKAQKKMWEAQGWWGLGHTFPGGSTDPSAEAAAQATMQGIQVSIDKLQDDAARAKIDVDQAKGAISDADQKQLQTELDLAKVKEEVNDLEKESAKFDVEKTAADLATAEGFMAQADRARNDATLALSQAQQRLDAARTSARPSSEAKEKAEAAAKNAASEKATSESEEAQCRQAFNEVALVLSRALTRFEQGQQTAKTRDLELKEAEQAERTALTRKDKVTDDLQQATATQATRNAEVAKLQVDLQNAEAECRAAKNDVEKVTSEINERETELSAVESKLEIERMKPKPKTFDPTSRLKGQKGKKQQRSKAFGDVVSSLSGAAATISAKVRTRTRSGPGAVSITSDHSPVFSESI